MGIDVLGVDILGIDILGIDILAPTLPYHTWPRIPMGKWQTHSQTPQTRAKRSALTQRMRVKSALGQVGMSQVGPGQVGLVPY